MLRFLFQIVALLGMVGILTAAKEPTSKTDEEYNTLLDAYKRQLRADSGYALPYERYWSNDIRPVKARRAPSLDNSYQWESMMQSLDNLRKPRFGRR